MQLRGVLSVFIGVAILITCGCSYDMSRQPRYNPMSPSGFFPDQRSARPVVEGTVANNRMQGENPFFTGRQNGSDIATAPVPITLNLLKRGRERYDVACSPCHSRLGNGEGMIVQRGFPRPPSLHIPRLRQAPDGHFYAVITEGFGKMWSYANRVGVSDRWAITAYIRALQLSQSASAGDVPPPEFQKLLGKSQ